MFLCDTYRLKNENSVSSVKLRDRHSPSAFSCKFILIKTIGMLI